MWASKWHNKLHFNAISALFCDAAVIWSMLRECNTTLVAFDLSGEGDRDDDRRECDVWALETGMVCLVSAIVNAYCSIEERNPTLQQKQ